MVYSNAVEKTLKNLASVSLFFLIVTGGLQLSSTFLLAQGANSSALLLLSQSLDLPFLLSALLYGSSKFSLSMEDTMGKGKLFFMVCCGLGVVALGAALVLNFTFADAQLFG